MNNLTISFPPGAGGNWFKRMMFNHQSLPISTVNFHYRLGHRQNPIVVAHELDPANFDYLYSGQSYINFYLNVIFKCFHHDLKIFTPDTYTESLLTSINTAKLICQFDNIKSHIYFDYDTLVVSPEVFYQSIDTVCNNNNFKVIEYDDFLIARSKYIHTCVNPVGVYEKFDNMFWVAFVMGELMSYNIVPTDFDIKEFSNWDRCQEFAFKNYQQCKLKKNVHYFDTDIFIPEIFYRK